MALLRCPGADGLPFKTEYDVAVQERGGPHYEKDLAKFSAEHKFDSTLVAKLSSDVTSKGYSARCQAASCLDMGHCTGRRARIGVDYQQILQRLPKGGSSLDMRLISSLRTELVRTSTLLLFVSFVSLGV